MSIEINGAGVITGVDSLSTPAVTNAAGSASTPSITFTGDTNTGLYSPGADQVAVTTGGIGRLFIDSSGQVGIGTSSPGVALDVVGDTRTSSKFYGDKLVSYTATNSSFVQLIPRNAVGTEVVALHADVSGRVGIGTTSPEQLLDVRGTIQLKNAGACVLRFNDSTTNYWDIINDSNLRFSRGGSEYARIDSSGRLLVGTSSSPSAGDGQYSKLVVQGNTGGSGAYASFQCNNPATLPFSAGDELAVLNFGDSAGRSFAQIKAFADGLSGTNDYPGRLVFSTTADGASSPTERVRITQQGYFKATSTGDYYGSTASYHESRTNLANNVTHLFSHAATSGNVYGIQISYAQNRGTQAGDQYIYCNDTASLRMEVRGNGGIANFQANNVNLSDINTKKDISPATGTWDCIKEWEIVNYRYKDQPDDADLNLGVIAQQVAESCPEVITVFQEAKDDQPEKLGVKEQQMYWMAIKALQEAQIRIETLEAKVSALESA